MRQEIGPQGGNGLKRIAICALVLSVNLCSHATEQVGIVTTVVEGGYSGLGDGGTATSAVLSFHQSVTVNASGNLFVGLCVGL